MAKPTDANVIGLVFSTWDDTYVACTTPEEVGPAADAVVADGGKPVLFHRSGHGRPDVVNVASGPGTRVQAHTIHGGVNLR